MPNKIDRTSHKNNNIVHQKEEFTQMVLSQIDDSFKPTERQFDKILDLEEKRIDYAFRSQNMIPEKYKWEYFSYLISLVIGLFIFVFISFYRPEYFSQVLSLVIGLVGGGFVGYSRGSQAGNRNKDI